MEKNHVLNRSLNHSVIHPAYLMCQEPKFSLGNIDEHKLQQNAAYSRKNIQQRRHTEAITSQA